jgi:hypothetical protein
VATALDPQEIDRRICWAVNGEVRSPVPAYSRTERLASRLIGWLQRNDIAAAIEEDGGTWYCVLRRGSQRIASGSGESRALAVARAAANCDFAAAPESRHRPRRSSLPRRVSGPGGERRCAVCDVALAPSKGPVRVLRLCNVCSWQRTRPETARRPESRA